MFMKYLLYASYDIVHAEKMTSANESLNKKNGTHCIIESTFKKKNQLFLFVHVCIHACVSGKVCLFELRGDVSIVIVFNALKYDTHTVQIHNNRPTDATNTESTCRTAFTSRNSIFTSSQEGLCGL